MANVELSEELTRLKVPNKDELAQPAAATVLGATEPGGTTPTSVQSALNALKLALDNATEEQLESLRNMASTIDQNNTATGRAIAEIQQQLGEGGGGGAELKSYINNSTILAGASTVLTVGQSTKAMLLYKMATAITQETAKNLDVVLSVAGNVIYRAESLAKSIDSTFPVFTEYFGDITLTLTNKSANSCDVAVKMFWSEL